MGWPVWSTRFTYGLAPGAWSYYRVPAGKRAVVKCVVLQAIDAAGGIGYVSVGPTYGIIATTPAPNQTQTWELTLVAYAGEDIGCMRSDNSTAIAVHGFLFDDPLQDLDAPEPAPGPPPAVVPDFAF